jgi:16S rRNA (guanine966-N2)-methyltransferase
VPHPKERLASSLMRTQLRIVAGSLRGRKLSYTVDPDLRPTPDMVRQALFSILGNAVPDRLFLDLFAGTGAVGFEALSRGAVAIEFVERDPRVASAISRHLHQFGVADRARVHRGDVYRWIERWQAPGEPVNLFLGPPFRDFETRLDLFLQIIAGLREKVASASVVVVQSEKTFSPHQLPGDGWEHRLYGRNQLSIWVK